MVSELSTTATPSLVRTFLRNPPPWLRVRDPGSGALAAITVDLDPGERAALALARELNADLVLVDDAAGRREALALRMRITGTVGVLRLAAERGLIDVPGVVAQLRIGSTRCLRTWRHVPPLRIARGLKWFFPAGTLTWTDTLSGRMGWL